MPNLSTEFQKKILPLLKLRSGLLNCKHFKLDTKINIEFEIYE